MIEIKQENGFLMSFDDSESRRYYEMRITKTPPRYIDCSFDNFYGGDKYKQTLKEWTKEKPFPNITIIGKNGCGKTHLATAIIRELINNDRMINKKIKFINCLELFAEIRNTFDNRSISEFELIKKYSEYDLLLLDELAGEKTTDWSIQTIYLILNNRYNFLRPTIVTANLDLVQIEQTIGSRIASRLAEGRIIQIDMPDYRKQRR